MPGSSYPYSVLAFTPAGGTSSGALLVRTPELAPEEEVEEAPASAVPPLLELVDVAGSLLQAKTKTAATAANETTLTDLFSISASYNRSGDDRLKQGPKHPGRKTC